MDEVTIPIVKPCAAVAVEFPEFKETLQVFENTDLFQPGDLVSTELNQRKHFGRVIWKAKLDPHLNLPLRIVTLSTTTASEKTQFEQLAHRGNEARIIAKQRTKEQHLDLKISKVIFTQDGQTATVYYTAPTRIDFRSLVLILAKELKAKITMKQISPREEARLLGGLGGYGPHAWWPEEHK